MVKLIIAVLVLLAVSVSPCHAVELDQDNNNAIDVSLGGTNATTAAGARTSLGLAIGTDVQAYSPMLSLWAAFTDPGVTALLKWDETANTFQYYAPTAWSFFYSGASSA